MNVYRGYFLVFPLLMGVSFFNGLKAQADFPRDEYREQYGNKTGWRGEGWNVPSHWTEFINYVPALMGPNSLPVPEVPQQIQDHHYVSFGGMRHVMEGDLTYNPVLTLYYSFKGVAALKVMSVPVERFTMSQELMLERNAYWNFEELNDSRGDIIVESHFQVLDWKKKKIKAIARVGLKTASGGNREMARHTDAPAYYFDLSTRKSWNTGSGWEIGVDGNLGFYAWQLVHRIREQNDAYLYGIQFSAKQKGTWEMQSSLAGYFGYLDNGDRPLVWRGMVSRAVGNKGFFIEGYGQIGLHDFEYKSIGAGVKYQFGRPQTM
ncbi:hypothetical protein [Algivirga pacifica]|uniref:Transporter n=1 Tax=Algivirga pacifica TaxID=1162670 RepID=A0ABP9DR10_9BACT